MLCLLRLHILSSVNLYKLSQTNKLAIQFASSVKHNKTCKTGEVFLCRNQVISNIKVDFQNRIDFNIDLFKFLKKQLQKKVKLRNCPPWVERLPLLPVGILFVLSDHNSVKIISILQFKF